MEELLTWVSNINNYLSDYVLIFLLAGTGVYFSFRTRWVQVRCFAEAWRNAFARQTKSGSDGKQLSSFQALATAVAAQVGTGNIVGASGAILTGGPGAIFWMWLIAFFGMATIAGVSQSLRKFSGSIFCCGGNGIAGIHGSDGSGELHR